MSAGEEEQSVGSTSGGGGEAEEKIDTVAEITERPSSPEDSSDKKNGTTDSQEAFAFLPPVAPPKPLIEVDPRNHLGSPSSTIPTSSSKESSKSPAELKEREKRRLEEKQEKYKQILSSLKYQPPKHAAPCADTRYNFEVLKNGTIVDSVKFSSFDRTGYFIVGRVPGCDIVAENPTVSRMHAILQFVQVPKEEATSKKGEDPTDCPQESGLYLYDLKSTHGTFLNKNQLFPHKFYRVHVGHVLKFGSSQRMYIVNGPDEDEEQESDKSVTELLNERLQKDLERKRLEEEEQLKRERVASNSKLPKENIEEEGIDWGMQEDADEESDMRINPFAIDYEASELNLENPKKSLRSWFEREGQDLEFEMREKGNGQYICRIALPIDGPTDGPVYAESEVKAKKKEAVHDATMKACQILDSHGLLRASNQESRKRKEKKWEDEDYYSSDEDTFLDRTGSIERKRQKRMRLAGKAGEGSETSVLTYDSLCSKYKELEKEIGELEEQIGKSEKMKERADDGDVDIDDYLNLLKSGVFDVKKLRGKLKVAKEEIGKTKKLMEIAKPAELPAYLQVKPMSTPAAPPSKASSEVEEAKIVEETPAEESTDDPSSSPKPLQTSLVKPMVGPRKPPSMAPPPTPPEPKRFGLITPAEFSALKQAAQRPPPRDPTALKKAAEEDEADAPFEEEEDSSEGEEEMTPSSQAAPSQPEEDPESVPEFTKPAKKKRQRYRNQNKNKTGSGSSGGAGAQGYQDDPNYSDWVPPTGQTGDGRTSLNEKLGY